MQGERGQKERPERPSRQEGAEPGEGSLHSQSTLVVLRAELGPKSASSQAFGSKGTAQSGLS